MAEERLQKILSRAGVASRRAAEQYIVEGRVTVNGKTITELGSKADLDRDHIKVDGRLLRAPKHLVYLALHKPKNVMTTLSDPEGRETIVSLLKGVRERVYPVGRLDYHSEGLLLLTNDGEFMNAITSARNKIEKVYVVKVNGTLTEEQEEQFRSGVPVHGRKTAPAGLKKIRPGEAPWYEVRLIEGRTNQIRLMFNHFGRLVEKLRRVRIGFLPLDVPGGEFRRLTPAEVERFRKLLKLDSAQAAGRGSQRRSNSADLAADGESVAREFLKDAQAAGRGSQRRSNSADLAAGGESVARESLKRTERE